MNTVSHEPRLNLISLALLGCVVTSAAWADGPPAPGPFAPYEVDRGVVYEHDDERLIDPRDVALDIWKLKEMAHAGRFAELHDLFNNRGLNMKRLPVGYAAGTGTRVLNTGGVAGQVINAITGASWKGKIYYRSENPSVSEGRNRIREKNLLGNSNMLGTLASTVLPASRNSNAIAPVAAFVTKLLPTHPLVASQTRSDQNLVILNYADNVTARYPVELILSRIQVYDVMVAVPGRYGPVFIGKTWLGEYDKNDHFEAVRGDHLMAWFFLDFNRAGVEEQLTNHWDGSTELPADRPVPETTTGNTDLYTGIIRRSAGEVWLRVEGGEAFHLRGPLASELDFADAQVTIRGVSEGHMRGLGVSEILDPPVETFTTKASGTRVRINGGWYPARTRKQLFLAFGKVTVTGRVLPRAGGGIAGVWVDSFSEPAAAPRPTRGALGGLRRAGQR